MAAINNHLINIQKQSAATCYYLYPKHLNIIQTFCLGLLERLSHTTLTLQLLFSEIEKEPKHEFSAGILVRALLLDTLISMNLYKIIKDAEEERKVNPHNIELFVEKYCKVILSDGLIQTFSYLELAKKLKFINEHQLRKTYENMAEIHRSFIKSYANDGSRPLLIHEEFYSPKKLFQKLAETNDLKKISTFYDDYLYFSKYDHFGILYYQIIREDHQRKLSIYLEAMEAFVAHQAFLHIVLARYSDNDIFLKAQAETSNQYLAEEVIEKH